MLFEESKTKNINPNFTLKVLNFILGSFLLICGRETLSRFYVIGRKILEIPQRKNTHKIEWENHSPELL